MRKLGKWFLLVLLVFLVVGQLYRPARTNPVVDPSRSYKARMQVTPEAARVIDRSCGDCHTNNTRWPWYTNVFPASWLVISDVNEARDGMNLSDWAGVREDEKSHHLRGMCKKISENDMPPLQYTLIHRDAVPSAADKKAVCDWTEEELKRLNASKAGQPVPPTGSEVEHK